MKFLNRYSNVSCLCNIYWDRSDKHYIARNANNPKEILFFLDRDKNNNPLELDSPISIDKLENEAVIELKDLTESVSKKVKIRYKKIYLDEREHIAFQYINHQSSLLYVELIEKVMMPIEDPCYGIVDEIYIEDISHDIILNYKITKDDVIIISEEEFLNRANKYLPDFQKTKRETNYKKILWAIDKKKYLVVNAEITFIEEGEFKDTYCVRLKSNTCMYVPKELLDEYLKAEEFVNRKCDVKKHKMILEFFGQDKRFFLSDVEISEDIFKILGFDFYRVKYHFGFYNFLNTAELNRLMLSNYKNKDNIEILFWNNRTYKLSVGDKIKLVWCFYTMNRDNDSEYIYSEYEVLNFITSDSEVNKNFIELYNLNNENRFGLDVESIFRRLFSINGDELSDNFKSKEYSFENAVKRREKIVEFI